MASFIYQPRKRDTKNEGIYFYMRKGSVYVCPWCKKDFDKPSELTIHMRKGHK